MVTTCSADAAVTDSAASATAMATGYKVNNGTVGLAVPGNGAPLVDLVEFFGSTGRSTGLVTTATMTHATPAGFGAHAPNRWDTDIIAWCYLYESRPNVLFGGGGDGMTIEGATGAGYTVIQTLEVLDAVYLPDNVLLSGQFGSGYLPYEIDGLGDLPHLYEMGTAAVEVLSRNPEGFFMMLEGGRIDHAAHANDLAALIPEVLAFERAVMEVMAGVAQDDALVIVTADHETGGLVVDENLGPDTLPLVSWTTGSSHSGADVPIYVTGKGAEAFRAVIEAKNGTIDNTDIFGVLTELLSY